MPSDLPASRAPRVVVLLQRPEGPQHCLSGLFSHRGRAVRSTAPHRNAIDNLARAQIASGFGFWDQTAGFDISQTLIEYSSRGSTYGRAFWVGLLNTLLVAGLGIVFATIIGFIVGIARLSTQLTACEGSRPVMSRSIRNLPLLLQLCSFWYNAVLKALPDIRDSIVDSRRPHSSTTVACFYRCRSSQGAALGSVVMRPCLPASSPRLPFMSGPASGRSGLGSSAPVLVVTLTAGDRTAACVFSLWLARPALASSFRRLDASILRGGIEILPEFVALLFGARRSTRPPSSPKWCAPAYWRCRAGRPRRRIRSACGRVRHCG